MPGNPVSLDKSRDYNSDNVTLHEHARTMRQPDAKGN